MDILDRIITSKEAAVILNYNDQYVKVLCQKGKLPAKKVGTVWIMDKEEIEKLVK